MKRKRSLAERKRLAKLATAKNSSRKQSSFIPAEAKIEVLRWPDFVEGEVNKQHE